MAKEKEILKFRERYNIYKKYDYDLIIYSYKSPESISKVIIHELKIWPFYKNIDIYDKKIAYASILSFIQEKQQKINMKKLDKGCGYVKI